MAFQAVQKKINQTKRKNCFELFGLDFMLDKDMNCFLIEVNTNPCLEETSKLLQMLLPRMLDDMFKLTIDKVFPKKDGQQPLMTSVLKRPDVLQPPL